MIAFDPQNEQHEGLLLKWWADLEPDRTVTFHSSLHRLGAFLRYFTQQAGLIFDVDKDGIWFAVWTEPLWDGVTFSTWIRKEQRTGASNLKRAWANLQAAYNLVFDRHHRVIGTTLQTALHSEHLKLGYEYCGRVPDICGGKQVYIYSMSREQWQNRKEVAARIRAEKKAKRQPRNGVVQKESALNGPWNFHRNQ